MSELTEEQVMSVINKLRFERRTTAAITKTTWKDGIDITEPSYEIMQFVAAITKMVKETK